MNTPTSCQNQGSCQSGNLATAPSWQLLLVGNHMLTSREQLPTGNSGNCSGNCFFSCDFSDLRPVAKLPDFLPPTGGACAPLKARAHPTGWGGSRVPMMPREQRRAIEEVWQASRTTSARGEAFRASPDLQRQRANRPANVWIGYAAAAACRASKRVRRLRRTTGSTDATHHSRAPPIRKICPIVQDSTGS